MEWNRLLKPVIGIIAGGAVVYVIKKIRDLQNLMIATNDVAMEIGNMIVLDQENNYQCVMDELFYEIVEENGLEF